MWREGNGWGSFFSGFDSLGCLGSGDFRKSGDRNESLHHVGLPVPKVLVTTDDVTQYKPHPEGYLKAAQRLSLAPEQCVVVEEPRLGFKQSTQRE
ncbi:MAG: hypothetical protein BRC47_14625 [Cyanobacteria bacterium QS_7_48_42]|nr:MAG: hypothetical protein BRC47_14625 [Cyanobacteria bacterium QS_7_48_42]